MNTKLAVALMILTLLSGCMGSEAVVVESADPVPIATLDTFIHAHQFWNEHPMGMANLTVVNHSGLLTFEAVSFFHAEGNLTILITSPSLNNSTLVGSEIVFQETFRNTSVVRHIPVSKGMVVQTLAHSGCHDPEVSPLGDFYTLHASITG